MTASPLPSPDADALRVSTTGAAEQPQMYALARAAGLHRAGQFEAALAILRTLQPTSLRPAMRARYFLLHGETCFDLGQYNPAMHYLREAASISAQVEGEGDAQTNRARALCMLGLSAYNTNRHRAAITALRQSLEVMADHAITLPTLHYSVRLNLANACIAVGEYVQALPFYHEVLAEVRETHALDQEAIIAWGLAFAYFNLGEAHEAIFYAHRSATLYHQLDETIFEARALTIYGQALAQAGRLEEAEQALRVAAKKAGETGDTVATAAAWADLANVYLRYSRAGEALRAARSGVEYAKKSGNVWTLGHCLYLMGQSARDCNDRTTARLYFDQALDTLAATGADGVMARIAADTGRMLSDLGLYHDAATYFARAYLAATHTPQPIGA